MRCFRVFRSQTTATSDTCIDRLSLFLKPFVFLLKLVNSKTIVFRCSSYAFAYQHISSNSSLTLLKTDSFAIFLRAIVSRTRAKGLSRLSVDDNTASKMFVCLSVQDLFFCVLERFTFFFFVFPKCSAFVLVSV